MSEDEEEKTVTFHTKEGVYYHNHMLKGLKNSRATLQRMMDKDVEETLYKLQRVNMKLDPNECAFGMEEGKFLGEEAEGQAVEKFFGKGEQVPQVLEEGSSGDSEARRDLKKSYFLGQGTEGLEKEYSHAVRLNFHALKDDMDYEALLVGLAAAAGRQMDIQGRDYGRNNSFLQVPNHTHSQSSIPENRSTNRTSNHLVRILEPGSFGESQDQTIDKSSGQALRGNKELVEESNFGKIELHMGRS
nr:hypothetical protein [Tanacetum cinerariifolium]